MSDLPTSIAEARTRVEHIERELEQAHETIGDLENERDEYLEALRGATARVFEERRKILPLRIERDDLATRVRGLLQAVEASEQARVALEERLESLAGDDETERIVNGVGETVARVRRPVIATEPVCAAPHPNRSDLRCGRPVGHDGGHADPEVVGALWYAGREVGP